MAVIRLNLSHLHSDELKQYARRRFIGLFCLRPWLFRRAIRDFCERDVRTPENVEAIVDDILASYVRVVSPPVVDPNEGWSPYFATDVLKDHGLRTGDYHRDNYDDGWWASAPYVDLDDEIMPSRAAFYIDGTEKVIQQLKLKGSFNYEPDPTKALNNFAELCFALLNRALPEDQGEIDPILDEKGDFARSAGTTEISRITEEYPSERGFDVTFLLRRGQSTSKN